MDDSVFIESFSLSHNDTLPASWLLSGRQRAGTFRLVAVAGRSESSSALSVRILRDVLEDVHTSAMILLPLLDVVTTLLVLQSS